MAIVALDTVACLTAEAFDFSYGALWPLSFLIYGTTAFVAAKLVARVRAGLLAGFSVAATDATLGWAISWLLGPGQPSPENRAASAVVVVALTVAATGVVVGLIAGLLGRRVAARSLRAR